MMSKTMLRTQRTSVLIAFAGLVMACGDNKGSDSVNTPPIADAGVSQSVSADSIVVLSGSGSYDPDGDPLTFTWSFESIPDGSSLGGAGGTFTVNDSADVATTFVPDAVGTFVVRLVVTDGRGADSAPDRTLIEITGGEAPNADAGPDQDGTTGVAISLDGSGSNDPLDRALTYAWSFAKVPEGSALLDVDTSDAMVAGFTPDVSGLYVAALTVSNGLAVSVPDTAVIRVSTEDLEAPVAVAGDDIASEDCTLITVDGSESSDPDGETLVYFWDIQSRPDGSAVTPDSFRDRTAAITTFYPDVAGVYILSLAVYDGTRWSAPDTITITADERSYNGVPAVYPGAPQSVDAGEAICEEAGYAYICAYCDPAGILLGFDAVIRDADRDPVSVLWEVVSGSATIENPTSLITEANLTSSQPLEPEACETTDYTFQLTATDCTGASATQQVTHQVVCCGITSGGADPGDSGDESDSASGTDDGGPSTDDGTGPVPPDIP